MQPGCLPRVCLLDDWSLVSETGAGNRLLPLHARAAAFLARLEHRLDLLVLAQWAAPRAGVRRAGRGRRGDHAFRERPGVGEQFGLGLAAQAIDEVLGEASILCNLAEQVRAL